jgi:hypothetical protein
MRFIKLVIFVPCLIPFAVSPWAQARREQNPVNKVVRMDPQKSTSISRASALLRAAGVWGGIEDHRVDCSPDQERTFTALQGSLKEGLNQLGAMDRSVVWKEEHGGILIRRNPAPTSLLDTRIKEFGFNKSDRPDVPTDALIGLPAVRTEISRLKLSVRSPELGFAQMRPEAASDQRIILRNVTVREVLNAVASADHPRVWLFQETTCGGQTTLLIQWLVK